MRSEEELIVLHAKNIALRIILAERKDEKAMLQRLLTEMNADAEELQEQVIQNQDQDSQSTSEPPSNLDATRKARGLRQKKNRKNNS